MKKNKKQLKAGKKQYRDELIRRFTVLQQQAKTSGKGVVLLVDGMPKAGCGSALSAVMSKADARITHFHLTMPQDQDEIDLFRREYTTKGMEPFIAEFWQALGSRGELTVFDRSWWTRIIERGTRDNVLTDATMDDLKAAIRFEKQLVDDGYYVAHVFIDLDRKEQIKRIEKLLDDTENRWRVSEMELQAPTNYSRQRKAWKKLMDKAAEDNIEWVVLNGKNKKETTLGLLEVLVTAFEKALSVEEGAEAKAAAKAALLNSAGASVQEGDERTRSEKENEKILKQAKEVAKNQAMFAPMESRFIDEDQKPKKSSTKPKHLSGAAAYSELLKKEQRKFFDLELELYRRRIPLIIVHEGMDAAGKGGAIKREASALDCRAYTVFPSPAPTKPELEHPFLWRYWTRLPKAGHVGIYDRSWYGRVLVERVEGFATPAQWARAYDEINEFESDLTTWGAIVVKFWFDITPEEQLNRFEAREQDPSKQWKITPEDWRNRDKRVLYEAAAKDMLRLTDTKDAPWTVIAGDDKQYARIEVLKTINKAIEKRLASI